MADRYVSEVAVRVSGILRGMDWNQDRAIALGHLLHCHAIECVDGFMINGDEGSSVLGYSDISQILEMICNRPSMKWHEWKTALPSGTCVSSKYEDERAFVEARIRGSEQVLRVL